jgi:hypothetical protein
MAPGTTEATSASVKSGVATIDAGRRAGTGTLLVIADWIRLE